MKLHFWEEKYKNFGDDLNSWLWSKYFDFSSSPDAPIFVGIGTIIDESIPVAERIIVFGSGAGYAKPPAHIGEAGFDIRFVRGPLSARLLKLDETKSITDPAILVADQFCECRRATEKASSLCRISSRRRVRGYEMCAIAPELSTWIRCPKADRSSRAYHALKRSSRNRCMRRS
jgi:hypothetical protein